mmetsp:Transcript_13676/g.30644  ORF Transcript_13676/g.30644 Transcript_13676/m.30644 type:complete len:328 (-) Transcript_13676:3591-4574(-)
MRHGLIANIDHRRWRIARESAVELTLTICRPSAGYLQSLSKVAHMEDPHIHREILSHRAYGWSRPLGKKSRIAKAYLVFPGTRHVHPRKSQHLPRGVPHQLPVQPPRRRLLHLLGHRHVPKHRHRRRTGPRRLQKTAWQRGMRVHARAGVPKQVAQVLALGRGEAQGGGGREVKPGEVAVAVAARGGADPGALAGALVHRDHLVEVAHGQVGPVAGLVDCGGVVTHLPEAAVVIPRLLRPAVGRSPEPHHHLRVVHSDQVPKLLHRLQPPHPRHRRRGRRLTPALGRRGNQGDPVPRPVQAGPGDLHHRWAQAGDPGVAHGGAGGDG